METLVYVIILILGIILAVAGLIITHPISYVMCAIGGCMMGKSLADLDFKYYINKK